MILHTVSNSGNNICWQKPWGVWGVSITRSQNCFCAKSIFTDTLFTTYDCTSLLYYCTSLFSTFDNPSIILIVSLKKKSNKTTPCDSRNTRHLSPSHLDDRVSVYSTTESQNYATWQSSRIKTWQKATMFSCLSVHGCFQKYKNEPVTDTNINCVQR